MSRSQNSNLGLCGHFLTCAVCLALFLLLISGFVVSSAVFAQEPLQPGEGFFTRFSGISGKPGEPVIDTAGTVGSIIDLRNPAQPPLGQHWLNEPQRAPVTAGQVGQIFGVAIDDAAQANIYVTATSAFGLHRTSDNSAWMPGMWGRGGGPGTVWKLDATNHYAPAPFATITLNGRQNTGAALGNIAYDKWNKQFYVSDLETGMIHRLRLSDGADLGHYDHGVVGRSAFQDVQSGKQESLPKVAFNPNSAAQITNCAAGAFANKPECWNFADFRRRVWGLGVRKDAESGEVRLYYAVWSSQGFGQPDYATAADDEKRNSLWSVAIGQNGDFLSGSVRREFILPDFFTDSADIARAGRSHPVSDIAFPKCSASNVMLVSERGGVRNLGLAAENPFATPNESRVLRYERDGAGRWQLAGRYDVGFYDRKQENPPHLRANSCGGVDFGYGYQQDWSIDLAKQDQFVWMNGDVLCSPQAPCFVPELGKRIDGSQVYGTQGTPEIGFSEVLPPGATQPYPPSGNPYPPTGPSQSWMIDADNNIGANGLPAMDSLTQNNATMIGDIEIYEPCDAKQQPAAGTPPPAEEPPGVEAPPPIQQPPIDSNGPDLAKSKDGPAQCVEGNICTFTITITNNGPGQWSGPLWELDTLPPGGILLDYRPQPDWLCNQVGGTQNVTCNYNWTTLDAGQSVTLQTDIFMPAGTAGQIVQNCVDDIWLASSDPNDPSVIQSIEQALAGYGYVVGPIDGILDIVTMNAISQFQSANGLPQTGLPDQTLIGLLFPGNAGMPGDSNPANDGDCHQVEIVPPPVVVPPPTATAPAAPDIEVRKVQTTGQCRPGGLCTFRVFFNNRGPGDWTGELIISDTLPAGATLVNAPVGCTQSGNVVTCRYPQIITLPPNSPGWVKLTARMPGNLRPGARNCASLSAATAINDPNSANNRHCIPIRVEPPSPDIMVHKVQVPATCTWGGSCNFDLWFINRGPGIWTRRIILTDHLPRGVKFVKASAPWRCQQSGVNLTCRRSPAWVKPGRAVRVRVTVQLPKDIKPGVKNCVRILRPAGTPRDRVPQNDIHCIPVRIGETAHAEPTDISVEKRLIGHCEPGGLCTFHLIFTNRGPGVWTGVPEMIDALPAGATLERPPVGCAQAGSTVTCRYPKTVIMPPNSSITATINAHMPGELRPGARNCVEISPSAAANDHNPGNNRQCIPIHVKPPPAVDIGVEKRQTGSCEPGGICTFQLRFINKGPGTWSGRPQIKDVLPAKGLKVSSWAPSSWTLKSDNTFEHSDVTIPAGGYVDLNVGLLIPENVSSDHKLENCAVIDPRTMNTNDTNPSNNRHCTPIDITKPKKPEQPQPPTHATDIQIEKMLAPYNPAGSEGGCETGCTIRITVVNIGSKTWSGPLVVRDVSLPPGTNIIRGLSLSQAQPGWTCDRSGRCSHPAVTLQPGQGKALDFYVVLSEVPRSGNWTNCAEIVDSRDDNKENDWYCIDIPVKPPPVQVSEPTPPTAPTNIRIEKSQTGACEPGGTCNFVIKFTNTGSGTWTGTARVSDVMTAGGATITNWSPRDWNCSRSHYATNCSKENVTLPGGQSLTLNVTMRVPRTITSGAQNCAIRTGERDANSSDDRHCIPVRTTPKPVFTPHPPTTVQPHPPEVVSPPPTVVCPRGTVRRGRHCVPRIQPCPRGTVRRGRHCIPRGPRCGFGAIPVGRSCIPIAGIIDTFISHGRRRPQPHGPASRCHRRPGGGIHCGGD